MEEKVYCRFCERYVSVEKFFKHIKTKHIENFSSDYEIAKYSFSCYKSEEIFYDIIKDYEVTSINELEKKYGFRLRPLILKLGLPKRGIGEANKLKSTQDRKKQTNLLKYGSENVSGSLLIKEKKKQTCLKKYGVENIWKASWFRSHWEKVVKEKYGKVCLSDLHNKQNSWGWKNINDFKKQERIKALNEKFLNWYNELNDEEREIYNKKKTRKLSNYNHLKLFQPSGLEKRIEEILLKNKIYFRTQCWINGKCYDFLFENKNLLEVQGDYWHCNPKKYKAEDLVKHPSEIKKVIDVWDRDIAKKENAKKYGYKIFYLWELDINKMTDEQIINFINENKEDNENNK